MTGTTRSIRLVYATLACCLLLAAQGSLAASVALVPAAAQVQPGGNLDLVLQIDATDVGSMTDLVQGQLLIEFDPALASFLGFMPAAGVTTGGAPLIGTAPGGQRSVTLSLFNAPSSGPMGTLAFAIDAAAGGSIAFGLRDADEFFGSFVLQTPTNQPFFPAFSGANVQVVPLPGAAWLLLSALALAGRLQSGRRNS